MITSTGFHGIGFGQNALGLGYKLISTALSPVASELNIDVDWNATSRAYDVVMSCCQDPEGIAGTSTANDWLVNIISEDPDE